MDVGDTDLLLYLITSQLLSCHIYKPYMASNYEKITT